MGKLSYNHIAGIKERIHTGAFSEAHEIDTIMQLGFDVSASKELLKEVVYSYKEELYFELKEKKEIEEKADIAVTIAIITSLLISVMAYDNGFLIILSIIIAGFAGFMGYPIKPIAGAAGLVTGAILMPFAVGTYLQNRDSFFSIEMIIPMALCFGPALLIKYLISKLMYSDDNV